MNGDAPAAFRFCPYDATALEMDVQDDRRLPTCRTCGFVDYQNPAPAVAVLVVDGDRVLLGRRAIEPARGLWDIPGGFCSSGETIEETCLRELREETGVAIHVLEYLGSLPDTYGGRRLPTLNFAFVAEIVHGQPRPASDIAELAWFPLDAVPAQMAFPHQLTFLQWCRERRRT